MKLLDLTLNSPAENLALDEALLESAEHANQPEELLRFWEPTQPLVVVGRSSRVETEVYRAKCRQLQIPIFRRSSGGASILTGPGCLMYSLILSYNLRPELRMVVEAHRFVLEMLVHWLSKIVPDVHCRGCSDLTLGNKKFSGNSMRCKRTHLLYHGTLLYNFPLEMIRDCLAMPPRQPDYRKTRKHGEFLTNLPVAVTELKQAIMTGFDAHQPLQDWPRALTEQLVINKYSQTEWNDRL